MIEILQGDALVKLKELPAESVQCCVTSPPYWGLRDYGTAAWEGGDAGCDHRKEHSMATSGLEGGKTTTLHNHYYRDECKCGARRVDSQLGLEKTPEEYVRKIVAVFREVRRVLRKDGTLWLNLGDSYVGGKGASGQGSAEYQAARMDVSLNKPYHQIAGPKQTRALDDAATLRKSGLKPKDLCGIPWRVAFALQADGWWLRSDIIWAKPNPMPESVTDRPTKSHEYIFLLTKSASYFYDSEAIQEKAAYDGRQDTLLKPSEKYSARNIRNEGEPNTIAEVGGQRWRRKHDGTEHGGNGTGFQDHSGYDKLNHPYVRNKRTVWTIATQPYPEAHFATYPPDLIKPCIMAGTKAGDTVLDPFAGSGTTGMVALELGRRAVLIELNPKYVEMIEQRCTVTLGLALS